MTDPNSTFITPVGRIVGGSLSKPSLKDFDGNDRTRPQWSILLAIPKTDPEVNGLIDKIKAIGRGAFASNPAQCERADFSWKLRDGDSTAVNKKGVRWCDKEGYPGHWVFSLSTNFDDFQVYDAAATGPIDAATVKTGDYVRILGDCRGNDNANNPGVYLNLRGAQFIREGERIATGSSIDAGAAFRAAMGGAPAPAAAPPAPDVVAKAVGQAPPAPPVAPPAPPSAGPQLTDKGRAESCDPAAWMASGWTEDQLRAGGYIV